MATFFHLVLQFCHKNLTTFLCKDIKDFSHLFLLRKMMHMHVEYGQDSRCIKIKEIVGKLISRIS